MEIELKWDNKERGAFVIEEAEGRTAEMIFDISGNRMTVYHTEVADKYKGQGVAGRLLARIVDHARQNKLQVLPRCAYVHAQFKRHPQKYADVWNESITSDGTSV